MQTQSPRLLFYYDPDFQVEFEPFDDTTANLHVTARNFSSSVLKRMYLVYAALEDYLGTHGYKKMITITPNPKFCKLFGGTTINTIQYNGKEHEVIEWVLRQ